VPAPRRVLPATPAQVLELAVALKTEAPDRTAAQVAVILAAHGGFTNPCLELPGRDVDPDDGF